MGPTGAKSWIYRYRRNGRLINIGLGPLLMVPLAKARLKAQASREQRGDGVDPLEAKRAEQQRRRLEAAKAMTFKECAETYIKAHKAEWRSAKSLAAWEGTLAAYAYPMFGDQPVQVIDLTLVMKALEPIWQDKPETASRLRGRIEAVLDWATVRGYRQGETRRAGAVIWINCYRRAARCARSSIWPHCPTPTSARLSRHCGARKGSPPKRSNLRS